MRWFLVVLLLLLVVGGCGHDYVKRVTAPAAPSDSTAAPCDPDDNDKDDD